MKGIKRSLTAAVVILAAAASAHAAVGDMALSASFSYASKYNQMGFGVQYQLEVFNNVRIAPEAIHFFKNDGHSTTDVNINAQYVIRTYAGFNIYPFVGFTYQHWDRSNYESRDRYGANLGCGAEYNIADHFAIFTEWKYQIVSDYNQSVTSVGLKYRF